MNRHSIEIPRWLMITLTFVFITSLLAACAPAPTAAPPTKAPAAATQAPKVPPRPRAPAAPTKAPAATTPKRGGTLTVAQNAQPRSMTSIIDPGVPGLHILMQTEEALLGRDLGNLALRVAKAMPETPDNLTFIFHLREDVKFHDGQPFTADDVIYGFERLLDPKYKASFGQVYRDNIAKVEAVRQVHRQVHHEEAVAHLPRLCVQ